MSSAASQAGSPLARIALAGASDASRWLASPAKAVEAVVAVAAIPPPDAAAAGPAAEVAVDRAAARSPPNEIDCEVWLYTTLLANTMFGRAFQFESCAPRPTLINVLSMN